MSELLSLFRDETLHIHANYYDNPFVSDDIVKMAELTKKHKPEEYIGFGLVFLMTVCRILFVRASLKIISSDILST